MAACGEDPPKRLCGVRPSGDRSRGNAYSHPPLGGRSILTHHHFFTLISAPSFPHHHSRTIIPAPSFFHPDLKKNLFIFNTRSRRGGWIQGPPPVGRTGGWIQSQFYLIYFHLFLILRLFSHHFMIYCL